VAYHHMSEAEAAQYLHAHREYNKRNAHLFRAYAKRQHAEKRTRTPAWSERKEILAFYKACPPGYEVDHAIPLKGARVSGLHVLGNLQYLPKLINRLKRNEFDNA